MKITYLTFLFLTFSTTLNQINITPIENGLLTLKLGTMRARTTQHKFKYYVNLQLVQNKLKLTETQLELIKTKIIKINNQLNDTNLLISIMQAKQLISMTKIKINNLKPKNNPRTKRGLINIVGTASKWLFATLDDDDRET